MRVNTRVTGTIIDIFNNMEGFNLCLSYCANTPGCFHWSWNTQGECRLLGMDGGCGRIVFLVILCAED